MPRSLDKCNDQSRQSCFFLSFSGYRGRYSLLHETVSSSFVLIKQLVIYIAFTNYAPNCEGTISVWLRDSRLAIPAGLLDRKLKNQRNSKGPSTLERWYISIFMFLHTT